MANQEEKPTSASLVDQQIHEMMKGMSGLHAAPPEETVPAKPTAPIMEPPAAPAADVPAPAADAAEKAAAPPEPVRRKSPAKFLLYAALILGIGFYAFEPAPASHPASSVSSSTAAYPAYDPYAAGFYTAAAVGQALPEPAAGQLASVAENEGTAYFICRDDIHKAALGKHNGVVFTAKMLLGGAEKSNFSHDAGGDVTTAYTQIAAYKDDKGGCHYALIQQLYVGADSVVLKKHTIKADEWRWSGTSSGSHMHALCTYALEHMD